MITTWEQIGNCPTGTGGSTYRMEVPGGWLVYVVESKWEVDDQGYGQYVNTPVMCFMPDPNHDWGRV